MTPDTKEAWEKRHDILEKSAKSLGYLKHRYEPFFEDSIYGNHHVVDTRYIGILEDEWCPLEQSDQSLLLQSTHNISIEILKIDEDDFKITATIKNGEDDVLSVEKESDEYHKTENIQASIVEISSLLYCKNKE